MDTLVSLCKRRGFIFQSSEIYGGLGSAWDYGPLGVELKRNVKNAWWRSMVQLREDIVGIDCAITMHPDVWKASGHVDSFADPFTGCPVCRRYFRADQLAAVLGSSRWVQSLLKQIEKKGDLGRWAAGDGRGLAPNLKADVAALAEGWSVADDASGAAELLRRFGKEPPCPSCGGPMSEPRPANLMLKTKLGPVEQTAQEVYLRPETAQGIFVNFENVLQAARKKLPFGIAQIGKSFRNEITPGNFIFRTREFEQMEMEFFVRPGTDEEWHQRWIDERFAWYRDLGIRAENLRLREHGKDELAHYAKRCVDVEFNFPMGWSELEGIANRADYDLKQHTRFSGKTLDYFDEETQTRLTPYVIEPAAGADRATLAFLCDAYHEEEVRGEKRAVLRLHPALAPVKVAVLPLLKKRDDIVKTCRALVAELRRATIAVYDDTAAIGRLYRRQDEVGTPLCVTVDVDTIETDRKVTLRDRDSMEQVRVPLDQVSRAVTDFLERGWGALAGAYEKHVKA
jgi:glycyl-tRNA synthetase